MSFESSFFRDHVVKSVLGYFLTQRETLASQAETIASCNSLTFRPRLHGTGRIWDRSGIRRFQPLFTRDGHGTGRI